MTEIFITNIKTKNQAKEVLDFLKANSPDLKINFDLNETENSYPCGHSILRVECDIFDSQNILTALNSLGYKCEILEDKVCL